MSFVFEERCSDLPFVERIFRTETGSVRSFLSVAAARWALVVTTQERGRRLTLHGPESSASVVDCPEAAEFMGILFRPGTVLPDLPASAFVDRDFDFPNARRDAFWWRGSVWPLPDFENADAFVARLLRADLLYRDPVVEATLRGEPVDLSPRSVQRRFVQTTGMSLNAIRQIERAQAAARLLEQGTPILDVVESSGYYDQAHLTASLKRYIGQTPAQLARNPADKSLF